jgi:hypothetical protein
LGRKDNLSKNILKKEQKYGEEFNITPKGYVLPEDLSKFQKEAKLNPEENFIVKPKASSCGRGISVIKGKDPVPLKECIIQKYIDNPLLIDGNKFDLRLYVCVTSYSPLKVYLYHDGLVRFSTKKYDMENIKDVFSHLTNYSINKKSKSFVSNQLGKKKKL